MFFKKASKLLLSSLLAFFIFLTGCAATGVREVTQNSQLPRNHDLVNTPFFPQELYQCGPAALATVLNAIDIKVSPETLMPEVYIPARQGSLQIEMLAAARRHGAIAVKIPPKLDALLAEVAAGNAVLVMQNLGLSWAPSWHYAVVVAYDLDQEKLWLRSGSFNRFEMTLSTFQRTWSRSDYWGFVALKPGIMPATATDDELIAALIAFEKSAPPAVQKTAYLAAVNQRPNNLVLLMGLGNSAYATGDLEASANAFKQAIIAHPNAVAPYNNLATVLLAQKLPLEAEKTAQQGLEVALKSDKPDARLKAQMLQTLEEIKAYRAIPPQ